MLRSIELGRAILCLPGTNLELWLSTLITISLKQDKINTQQLKSMQILNLLSSGKVWLHRGLGMYVELYVTLRGEPVSHGQLQDLSEILLAAPLWKQLMLQSSLPTDVKLEPGIIRLNINYIKSSEDQQEQQYHRILSDVPAADIRPPEGIPVIDFHSVRFSLQFLDPRPRQRTTRKRPKATADEKVVLQTHLRSPDPHDSEDLDDLLHEVGYPSVDETLKVSLHSPKSQPIEKKRKISEREIIFSLAADPSNPICGPGREPESSLDLQPKKFPIASLSDQEAIESLVDGAVRLSIYGSFTAKSACGIKVKANTFHLGLADVAPALWRPGYLPALSQRAILLDTISRSINQAARVKATSMSLKHKVHRAEVYPTIHPDMVVHDQVSVADSNINHSTSSIRCQLWRHVQKTLKSRSATSLHTLIAYEGHAKTHLEPEEMLSEAVQPEPHLKTSMLNREGDSLAQLDDRSTPPGSLPLFTVMETDLI